MEKKPVVSVTYENERISVKNSLPYLKCVLRLSCLVHRPIYGRFMGFYREKNLSPGRFSLPWLWRPGKRALGTRLQSSQANAADFANRECSFRRFNDAFQKTLLEAGSLACEKHLFVLALRRWRRFARRNVCDSAASLRFRR